MDTLMRTTGILHRIEDRTSILRDPFASEGQIKLAKQSTMEICGTRQSVHDFGKPICQSGFNRTTSMTACVPAILTCLGTGAPFVCRGLKLFDLTKSMRMSQLVLNPGDDQRASAL